VAKLWSIRGLGVGARDRVVARPIAIHAMSANLFSTVPTKDHLGFWADRGLDAQRVAKFLSLDKREVAHLADVAPASVRWDHKIPQEVLQYLTEIAVICGLVAQFFQGDATKTQLWFQTKNPLLGNISPRDMVRYGRHEKLRRVVMDALTENGIAVPSAVDVTLHEIARDSAPKTRPS
jgi:hypothetical protein